jgi:hypothetical protein
MAVLAMLVSGAPLLAHHSLANYDITQAFRVKGTIVQVNYINPHSFIYLEEKTTDGQIRRWAVEGPTLLQIKRRGFEDALKPGMVIEACGYLPKEPIVWQIVNPTGGASLSGRLLNGELIVMPDGHEESWGDYGVHRCYAPGRADQHSK